MYNDYYDDDNDFFGCQHYCDRYDDAHDNEPFHNEFGSTCQSDLYDHYDYDDSYERAREESTIPDRDYDYARWLASECGVDAEDLYWNLD